MGDKGSIPGRGWDFLFSIAQTAFYIMETDTSFSGGKIAEA
jgi:hypothetical protein